MADMCGGVEDGLAVLLREHCERVITNEVNPGWFLSYVVLVLVSQRNVFVNFWHRAAHQVFEAKIGQSMYHLDYNERIIRTRKRR